MVSSPLRDGGFKFSKGQKVTKRGRFIVGTPPPSPILKERGVGRTFQKLSHLRGGRGVRNLLLERGDKPEKGVSCRNGGVATF